MLKSALFSTLLLASTLAHAGFEYTRSTTIRDELGGTFTMSAAGTLGEENATRAAEGAFANFHLRNDASAVLSGGATREAARDGDLVVVTYDGNLSLVTTATPSAGGAPQSRTTTIVFTDLTVERAEEGSTIAGTVIVNGQSVDATALPRAIKAAIVNALRFFRL